jgi:chromate transporter
MRCRIERRSRALLDLAVLFTKLGTIGFGGPAAHVALMRDEVVRRRHWMSDEEFLDAVGVVNLLPGPNSTELAIHIGRRQAGWPGLVVAGMCFITPAMLIVLGCAWVYVRYGHMPAVAQAWHGAAPVVVAVVVVALAAFGRTALRTREALVAAGAALALTLAGVHELLVLVAAGLVVPLLRWGRAHAAAVVLLPLTPLLASEPVVGPAWLFGFFLKIGAVLYGSGYVLLAFIRGGLVERGHLLTEAQLLDAITIGQVTPGPVFTTATFIGYLVAGVAGALAATAGIFLPAFVLVAVTGTLVPWIRRSPRARAVLDGVNAGSLALMAVVTVELGRSAVTGWRPLLLALAALALLRAGVNSAWLVVGGAVAGLLLIR